jgi:hypothetical protein
MLAAKLIVAIGAVLRVSPSGVWLLALIVHVRLFPGVSTGLVADVLCRGPGRTDVCSCAVKDQP